MAVSGCFMAVIQIIFKESPNLWLFSHFTRKKNDRRLVLGFSTNRIKYQVCITLRQ